MPIDKFIEWLKTQPDSEVAGVLALFMRFAKEVKMDIPAPQPSGSGPTTINVNAPPPAFATVGLSQADLDAFAKDAAEAIVKEKAIMWIRGFISGISSLGVIV